MNFTVKNRVKTAVNINDLHDRLSYQPEIVELHLTEHDLYGEKKKALHEAITYIKESGAMVYLHHPMKIGNKTLDIISQYADVKSFYMESCRILFEICTTHNIQCVIHCNYSQSDNSIEITSNKTILVKKEIEKILSYGRHVFLWEDSIDGVFSFRNEELFTGIIQPLALPLVQDVSHSFIALQGDNNKLLETTKLIHPYVQYMHLVDSMGVEHDGLPLGEGKIDWKAIKPYTLNKNFIFEISLEDVHNCLPMIKSCDYYNSI